MKIVTILVLAILLGLPYARGQDVQTSEKGDFNFDGHQDYRQQAANPGNQCGWWDYFIFDEALGKHRLVETSFCKEEFDAATRVVKTRVSGGMAGDIYVIRYFRWDGLELVPTFAEKQDYDSRREIFIRTRVTNIDKVGGPSIVAEVLTPEQIAEEREQPE